MTPTPLPAGSVVGAAETPRADPFFFFKNTATTKIYTSVHTLSLHDALPILPWRTTNPPNSSHEVTPSRASRRQERSEEHTSELQSRTLISYAVFCLKKK